VEEESGLGESDGAGVALQRAGDEADFRRADVEFGDFAGLDALVARFDVLLRAREAGPDLDAVDVEAGRGLFGMDDAAAGGDPLGATGADAVVVAEGVTVGLFAGEEVGDDLDAGVRVGGDAAAFASDGGAEMIEEDEGADVAAAGLREGAENGEVADGGGVGMVGFGDGAHT